MARTRGAHSVGGKSSQQGHRIRPTASAHKRTREGDVGVLRVDVVHEHQHVDDDSVVDKPQNFGEVQEEHEEGVVYPGGPYGTSLLTSYFDHVAFLLWQGEVSVVIDFF